MSPTPKPSEPPVPKGFTLVEEPALPKGFQLVDSGSSHPFVGPKTPPSVGEDFLRTVGDNISNLPEGLWNTVFHLPTTLKSLAVPMTGVHPPPGSVLPEMTPGEMLGQIATVGGLGLAGKAIPPIAEGLPKATRATAAALREIPVISRSGIGATTGGLIGYGLHGTPGAAMGTAIGAGLGSLPEVIDAFRRNWNGPQEVFTGKAGLASGVPGYFAHEVQDLPQVTKGGVKPPPVKYRPEESPRVVPAPGVTFRSESSGPQVVPPPPIGPMRPSAVPGEEVFTGAGGGPPVKFSPEDLPSVRVVSPPPVGPMRPSASSPETFGARGGGPPVRFPSASVSEIESLQNEMRSAGIPEEGVQNPAIQDLFAKNRKGPGTPPGSSGLGTPPPSTTPVGEGHFAPGGKAQQIMATNAQVKNLNVASSLRAKGITPEKWLELPLDKQNELIKEAHPGHREYVHDPAPNRPGRGASEGIMDIHKVLSDLWNTLP